MVLTGPPVNPKEGGKLCYCVWLTHGYMGTVTVSKISMDWLHSLPEGYEAKIQELGMMVTSSPIEKVPEKLLALAGLGPGQIWERPGAHKPVLKLIV